MINKNKGKRIVDKDRENLLLTFPSNSIYAESYRTLRANLFFSLKEKDTKSIVITSSLEKEGKTTTAINLAYTIAQTDQKVLLMDCDLRRPHLTDLFSNNRKKGVAELVTELFGTRLANGSLETYSINDLVLMTRLQKRSCRLHLENTDTQMTLSFKNGHMIDINWKNKPEDKKIANILIKKKLLSKKNAYLAFGQQKKRNQHLGSILYTMGFVSKKNILKTLCTQTIDSVKKLSLMDGGEFVFSNLSSDEDKSIIIKNAIIKKLYAEFTSADNNLKYIKKTIDSAIRETETNNLFVLPGGRIPSKPSELIGSKQMEFLVKYLKKTFDFIVIDTPPVMLLTDALLMAPTTDGTVFVIKSGNTEHKIMQDVVNQYKTANLPILGSVLNLIDLKKEGYYYRYYRKYYAKYDPRKEAV
ncbi:MAG: CpsD/CapB family tyrosine-protein kinase [Desulfobacteraceae bacterium]|nr:CpsD/CapB family tyrosine-protein kinase [Desulfobacteraceae bacterium]